MAQVSLTPHDFSTTLSISICLGLLSRELCTYVKSIVGVDISQGVVDFFNLRASNQGLAPEEMKAVCVDLKLEDHELRGTKFNVIVVRRALRSAPDLAHSNALSARWRITTSPPFKTSRIC